MSSSGWLVLLCATTSYAQPNGVVGPPMNRLPAAKVDKLPPAQDLDAAMETTCAVAAGDVYCWGSCEAGHCDGTKGPTAQHVPQKVPGIANATQVSISASDACALLGDGSVSCWGLGKPQRLTMPAATAISHGGEFACALGTDHAVRCRGDNSLGQLGQGPKYKGKSLGESARPLVVKGVKDAIAIAAGRIHACAVLRGGDVVCWGEAGRMDPPPSEFGQLETKGEPGEVIRDGAVRPIKLPRAAVSVSAGHDQSCALLDDGHLQCWDYNYRNVAITGPTECRTNIRSLDDHAWYAVGTRGEALRVEGYCSGDAVKGMPVVVENSGTCARTASGEIWCWDTNQHGQLGRPATPFYR